MIPLTDSLRACAVTFFLVGSLAASEPAPAVVTSSDGKVFDKAFVTTESFDGLTFVDGDPHSQAQLSKKRGDYSVEYKPSINVDYLKATKAEDQRDYAKAFESFAQVLINSKFDWERQAAYLESARCAEQLKKPDDGIPLMQRFEKEYPKSIKLPDGYLEWARLLTLKGDADGASKILTVLIGHERDWGLGAAAKGAIGLGELLAGGKKYADGINQLMPWFASKLTPQAQPDEFATIGLLLAQCQLASGAAPAAMDTYHKVAFSPISPDQQARAHLALGKMLIEKGDASALLAAFDQAAIAATLKGVTDGSVHAEAVKFAVSIVPKLGADMKDEKEKAKIQFEYKNYLGQLQ